MWLSDRVKNFLALVLEKHDVPHSFVALEIATANLKRREEQLDVICLLSGPRDCQQRVRSNGDEYQGSCHAIAHYAEDSRQ